MNNNKTIYCWQIDTTRKENILKATDGDSSRAIKVGDKVHATTAKKAKEPKFVEFDYSYYASPVPATDSMFCIKDTVDNKEEEYETISIDSIFLAAKREAQPRKTMFQNHEYQRVSYSEKNNVPEYYPAWVFVILLLVLLVIGWIFNASRVRVQQVFKASMGQRNLNLLFREGNILKEKIIIPIVSSFIILLSLVIYAFMEIYDYSIYTESGIINYLLVVFGVTGLVVLRHMVVYFLGNLFKFKTGILYYLANNVCYYFLETMFLLPMTFFLFYTDTDYLKIVTYVLLISLSILVFLRLFRGLSLILLESRFSQLYLFYYLCIVEVIPFFVLIKLVLF
ncbi:MAG: DUF4271 domain-containing protein [Bacteroidales bacterium]|nr:DUF4271 domain-containing protein [Bacteroidales bacterium]